MKILKFILFSFNSFSFSFSLSLFFKAYKQRTSSPTKHREKGYLSFWGEDIVVFEMQMKNCRLLKACNDWRHYRLRHVDEHIVAFEGMQWLKTLSSSKCKWGSLSPLKACNDWRHFCLRNVCGLPYRASLHATCLLTGRGSRTVCVCG